MAFLVHTLRAHLQLLVLLLWVAFISLTLWQHAQQSRQPPTYDASTYYLKAYNFWNKVHQHRLFNPFNVEPTFRPPGTILMSYPFDFDTDYRGFYFRSIFLPIALLVLAVVIAGYRHELDIKCKWHLVLFAAFLSSLPCFYYFELTSDLPIPVSANWGLVDNFLAGVAALATAARLRSVWTRCLAWLSLGAALSSFCLLIKPAGGFIMLLIGFTWFGLTLFNLRSVWQSPDERKSMTRSILLSIIIFSVFYLTVITAAFNSYYLSPQNLAFGKTALGILQAEWSFSWLILLSVIRMGVGYLFVAWLVLMIIVVANHLRRMPIDYLLCWPKSFLTGLSLSSCITLLFGIWFWIVGTGGTTQIRYTIPFVIMAMILAFPTILISVRTLPNWKIAIVSVLMIAPIINMGLLLAQRNPSIEWQKWTGVNLTSGVFDPVIDQAQNFVRAVKQGGKNVTIYTMSLNMADADFQSVVQYANFTMPPMPIISILRPMDWQRPTTFRKEEMLIADYWLFQPVRDPSILSAKLAATAIEDLDQETMLFQAWATQLTTKEGVVLVSDTSTARVLRITDRTQLESAFDALVKKHSWRSTFINENPKRQVNEKELAEALVLNPPSLENVNFGGRFLLRALSASHTENDITVRIWWHPLSSLIERDWILFIHSFNQ
jgi:hypothetical protein